MAGRKCGRPRTFCGSKYIVGKNNETDMLNQLRETVNCAREHDCRIAGRIGAWLFILASDYAYYKVGLELDDDCGITDRRSIYF